MVFMPDDQAGTSSQCSEQENVYFLNRLKHLRSGLPEDDKKFLSDALLSSLSSALLDDTVFLIVNELKVQFETCYLILGASFCLKTEILGYSVNDRKCFGK